MPIPTALVLATMALPASAQPPAEAAPVETGPAPAAWSGPRTLAELTARAVAVDPRTRTIDLLERQSALRLRNISASWLPSIHLDAFAQHQSDAAVAPIAGGDGRPVFAAPRSTYDGAVRIEQRVLDPSVAARARLEHAHLAERQARVRSALFAVRQDVTAAFFAAASLQQREEVLQASIAELEGRLREVATRVRAGVALPADAQMLEATLLSRELEADELQSHRRVALERLSTLVDRVLDDTTPLDVPDLTVAASEARRGTALPRRRPELQEFDRTRDRLDRQRDLVAAERRPRLSAFVRTGYGRPGLNFINDELDAYALGGLQLRWAAWTWGTAARERAALALQQDIVDAEEAAFLRTVRLGAESEWPAIERLERAVVVDARIIELREQVERSAHARLVEGVLTAAEYLTRNTELLQARAALAMHEVELAEARARVLTTLGLDVAERR